MGLFSTPESRALKKARGDPRTAYRLGVRDGLAQNAGSGYDAGYADGRQDGQREGYDAGYTDGAGAGSAAGAS